jgi:hypothetical protein
MRSTTLNFAGRQLPFSYLLLSLLLFGCATGGPANANAPGSVATGGAATNVVSISPSIALGDKVADAASKAAEAYLKTLSLPASAISAADKKTAVDKGVEAGVAEAQRQGKQPTAADQNELRAKLEVGVDTAIKNSGSKKL